MRKVCPVTSTPQTAMPPIRSTRRRSIRYIAGVCIAGVMLAGCTGVPEGVVPVTPFDISRYQGVWYEIQRLDHRFERGLTNVTANYSLRSDGKVSVVNRGFNSADCEWSEATGTAKFLGDESTASLAVTFFWPFAGGYHIFELDRDNYSYALVAGPSKEYLWLLARDPELDPALEARLIEDARALGFPVENLINVTHDEGVQDCTGQTQAQTLPSDPVRAG